MYGSVHYTYCRYRRIMNFYFFTQFIFSTLIKYSLIENYQMSKECKLNLFFLRLSRLQIAIMSNKQIRSWSYWQTRLDRSRSIFYRRIAVAVQHSAGNTRSIVEVLEDHSRAPDWLIIILNLNYILYVNLEWTIVLLKNWNSS